MGRKVISMSLSIPQFPNSSKVSNRARAWPIILRISKMCSIIYKVCCDPHQSAVRSKQFNIKFLYVSLKRVSFVKTTIYLSNCSLPSFVIKRFGSSHSSCGNSPCFKLAPRWLYGILSRSRPADRPTPWKGLEEFSKICEMLSSICTK